MDRREHEHLGIGLMLLHFKEKATILALLITSGTKAKGVFTTEEFQCNDLCGETVEKSSGDRFRNK